LGGTVQELETDLVRLDDVLAHPTQEGVGSQEIGSREKTEGGAATPTPYSLLPTPSFQGRLELRAVAFGYHPLDPPLLQGLEVTVPVGGWVALVGGSGSGKSTIAKLVTGLYAPWSGEVLLDGRPRGEWPAAVLGRGLAFVDQDIFLFEGTIR